MDGPYEFLSSMNIVLLRPEYSTKWSSDRKILSLKNSSKPLELRDAVIWLAEVTNQS